MSRATEEALAALHGLLADTLREQIEKAKASEEGIPPALLAQAIKFLKDNGIDSPALKGSKVDTLAEAMPDFDEISNVTPMRKIK